MHTASRPTVLPTVKTQPFGGVVSGARTWRRRAGAPGCRLAPLLALIIALLATVTGPSTAWAHVGLRSSVPARAAQLTVVPRELRLVFSEAPELAVARIGLIGPDGQPVALGPLAIASDRKEAIVVAIEGRLAAGTYTVRWQIAGADGHPIRGDFPFTIVPQASGLSTAPEIPASAPVAPVAGVTSGEPGAAVTPPGQAPVPAVHHDPSTMPDNAGGFDAESPAYVVIRWLLFSALLVVIGALAFHFAVLGFLRRRLQQPDSPMLPDARNRAAVIGLWGAAALVPIALLRLYAQSYALHGADAAFNGSLITAMLTRTTWGWGWILQLGAAIVAVAGFAMARRARSETGSDRTRLGWTVAALAGLVLAFTPALAGHASSAPQLKALAIVADALHIIGAGGWLGSLLFVLAAGIPAALRLAESERGQAVADLVNAFSPTALIFAGLVGVTGVFAGWLHVGAISALWQTTYGQILLLKLGVLSIVALTGAYNWRRVRPALGTVEGAQRIKRSAGLELGVAVVVLVITAILVATPTPMDMEMMLPDGTEMSPSDVPTAAPGAMR